MRVVVVLAASLLLLATACAGLAEEDGCAAQREELENLPLVASRQLEFPPECPGGGEIVVSGTGAIEDAAAFTEAYGCEPGDLVDFENERVVEVSADDVTALRFFAGDGVVLAALERRGGCRGAPPAVASQSHAIPRQGGEVELRSCMVASCTCGGFPNPPCPP